MSFGGHFYLILGVGLITSYSCTTIFHTPVPHKQHIIAYADVCFSESQNNFSREHSLVHT